jgi:shikimate dehydrogenase
MHLTGLIGDPVSHSRSPAMQNAAFAALGIDARYDLWPTPLVTLPERVASLRAPEMWGANVTIPHKRAVTPLLDEIAITATSEATVAQVGAVNTIVNRDGRLVGYNTDAGGLVAALREAGYAGFESAVVLGAGGAARAAIIALWHLAARELHIVARNGDAAVALAQEMAAITVPCVLAGNAIASLPDTFAGQIARAGILVNATPAGMGGSTDLPLDARWLDRLPDHALVLDLVTATTPLLAAASARGLATMNGLPMLLHQGALAFTLWTGQPAPLAVMRAALGEG